MKVYQTCKPLVTKLDKRHNSSDRMVHKNWLVACLVVLFFLWFFFFLLLTDIADRPPRLWVNTTFCDALFCLGNVKNLKSIHAMYITIATNAASLPTHPWWRHQMETCSALLALCAGNSPVPMNSPHKGQWRRALMFSLICAWINDWVNNREAGDLRSHQGHYDVNVMLQWRHTERELSNSNSN